MNSRVCALASLFALAACGPTAQSNDDGPAPDPAIVWAAVDSPRVLSEDLTIASDEHLVIEAGVTVELAQNVSLIIQGELTARGSEASPIVFTGDAELRWKSIVFEDTAVDATFEDIDDYVDGSILEYVTIEHGNRAVHIVEASPYISHCTFRDNQAEVLFSNVGGGAILLEGGEPRIRDSLFENNIAEVLNQGGAILATRGNPILQDNVFRGNESPYGGAVTTDLVASPIVGNLFEQNTAMTKGGGLAIVSTCSAVFNNVFTDNVSKWDGGGLHVCVECSPHATPFIMDNTVTGNHAEDEGAGGVGAAFLRAMAYNNIHDNTLGDGPSDFGWFHDPAVEGFAAFANPTIAKNWWGTTDPAAIAERVFDGTDDPLYGLVTFEPVLSEAVAAPTTRVALTSRRIRYLDADEPMPVFLTLYNPGPARDLELLVLLTYGERAVATLDLGGLALPDAQAERGRVTFTMPENSVFFTTLLAPTFSGDMTFGEGTWFAALFDPATRTRVSDPSHIRFELGLENPPPASIPSASGAVLGSDTVHIGDTAAALTDALGSAPLTYDLGALGMWFDHDPQGLAGLLSGPGGTLEALVIDDSFTGTLEGDVALGADADALDAELGEGLVDPFLGARFYPDAGVSVSTEGAAIQRAVLF